MKIQTLITEKSEVIQDKYLLRHSTNIITVSKFRHERY